MIINGKETELRFDVGAMKLFKKLTGKDFLQLKMEEMDTDDIASMVYAFAVRGNPEITMDDIDSMGIGELVSMSQVITKLEGNVEGR